MKRFTRLYSELDRTTRTNEKLAALETYFKEAVAPDAAWALYFLRGGKLPRTVNSTFIRELAAGESGIPRWLLDECHEAVGDLAETVALLLPDAGSAKDPPLHELVQERLLAMRNAPDTVRKDLLLQTWRELNFRERFVWNKLITGAFRVGVAETLVTRALANLAGVEQAVMAHRLMGKWEPTPDDFRKILSGVGSAEQDAAKPYPFFLASPLEGDPSDLGDESDWQVEWKWDGIRAQLIHRQGQVVIWSRGDEMVTPAFPEIAEVGAVLPEGTVLDGEILAWQDGRPEPFSRLQRRLGRKQVSAKMRSEAPVIFLAYDLLEWNYEDWRPRPLSARRLQLESLVKSVLSAPHRVIPNASVGVGETLELFPSKAGAGPVSPALRLSDVLESGSWKHLAELQQQSRARQVEGLMLKRVTSPYGTGRQRGNWWKWKIDPLVLDAVLINAQSGHGRRANLYTDYTFAVWDEGKLVPIAKAYSGLDDAEILEVDKFVRGNTIGKFGPIRVVKPELVFELAFEAVQESTRHKTGIAVRFPRMNRWRRDKKPADADTLASLRAFLRKPTR